MEFLLFNQITQYLRLTRLRWKRQNHAVDRFFLEGGRIAFQPNAGPVYSAAFATSAAISFFENKIPNKALTS
jgi:hypothetical protein